MQLISVESFFLTEVSTAESEVVDYNNYFNK